MRETVRQDHRIDRRQGEGDQVGGAEGGVENRDLPLRNEEADQHHVELGVETAVQGDQHERRCGAQPHAGGVLRRRIGDFACDSPPDQQRVDRRNRDQDSQVPQERIRRRCRSPRRVDGQEQEEEQHRANRAVRQHRQREPREAVRDCGVEAQPCKNGNARARHQHRPRALTPRLGRERKSGRSRERREQQARRGDDLPSAEQKTGDPARAPLAHRLTDEAQRRGGKTEQGDRREQHAPRERVHVVSRAVPRRSNVPGGPASDRPPPRRIPALRRRMRSSWPCARRRGIRRPALPSQPTLRAHQLSSCPKYFFPIV